MLLNLELQGRMVDCVRGGVFNANQNPINPVQRGARHQADVELSLAAVRRQVYCTLLSRNWPAKASCVRARLAILLKPGRDATVDGPVFCLAKVKGSTC